MLPDILGYEVVNKAESVKRERNRGSVRGTALVRAFALLIGPSNELARNFPVSSTLAIPDLLKCFTNSVKVTHPTEILMPSRKTLQIKVEITA